MTLVRDGETACLEAQKRKIINKKFEKVITIYISRIKIPLSSSAPRQTKAVSAVWAKNANAAIKYQIAKII